MKPSKLLRCTVLALGTTSLASQARADEFDWLYFPMYPRDTAHAVHLAALQRRADGLLESATRYPRVPEDQWSKAESDAGWYDYKQRLIDCQTGLAIVTREHLLDRDGKTIASHDNTAQNLARWKAELATATQPRAWPEASEIFLACAAAADQTFLTQRRQARKTKPATLSYRPLIQGLQAQTHDRFGAKARFRLDLEILRKRPPANPERLFEALHRQHRAWLAGFAPELTAPMGGKSAAALSEENLRWLDAHGIQVARISSRPDGVVRATVRQPNLGDLPPEYQERPPRLDQAEAADLELYLDCASGLQVATRLTWRDRQGAPVLGVPLAVKALRQQLAQQGMGADNNAATDVLSPALGGSGRAICMAVAAQCRGKPAAEPEALRLTPEDQATIQQAADPATALLAARQLSRRRAFIPDCVLGPPF